MKAFVWSCVKVVSIPLTYRFERNFQDWVETILQNKWGSPCTTVQRETARVFTKTISQCAYYTTHCQEGNSVCMSSRNAHVCCQLAFTMNVVVCKMSCLIITPPVRRRPWKTSGASLGQIVMVYKAERNHSAFPQYLHSCNASQIEYNRVWSRLKLVDQNPTNNRQEDHSLFTRRQFTLHLNIDRQRANRVK